MTIIELTEHDAQAFLLFRKYQDKFALLVETQVFDVRNGSAEIHFNRNGDIASIDLHAKVFRRVELGINTVDSVKNGVL